MFSLPSTLGNVLLASSFFYDFGSATSIRDRLGDAGDGRLRYLNSNITLGASISYKQTSICETTPGVKAFSGYIHIPSSLLEGHGGSSTYNASMFFWYFESRKDPKNAPLSLYLGGGPGTTSLGGATAENGPCTINSDSNSTTLNPWSWNNNVNMLYVDQPVQVGFSYDTLVPSTLDLLTGNISPHNGTANTNGTFVSGVLPSQDPGSAANTTANAANIMWQFTQIWIQEFPEHKSSDDRVSVWANSYGGHWGPGVMAHFESQNRKICNGTLNGRRAKYIHLDTLGLTNACVDSKIEGPFYPIYAFNNTYGLKTISEELYHESLNNFTKPGGCNDLIDECRAVSVSDLENTGTNETVNAACALATQYCFAFVQGAYVETSGRNFFDISRTRLSFFPPEYIIGYMNQNWVQRDLGVPLNFSISANPLVDTYFGATGDPMRVSIDSINYVAQSGIKVAFVFGDRDYRCNWLGGEAISLAMSYPSAPAFQAAGYAPLITTSNHTNGVVRQHGRVSFSRIFEAGHSVGAFQPEAVSTIFDRVMFDTDVATGNISILSNAMANYSTTGPTSSFGIKNSLVEVSEHECYVWDAVITCDEEEQRALMNGSAVVQNWILTSFE
ncbi:alpha/beta-hydrolase [Melanomma pulvis-pyrius CBS 109.77]|uniref:Alpha/beta-hydrolase n=1 Tax=Melanomma pulvis-pyrius CBS 109.77 TaxID=1314802 RepID=A0A6A6XNI2_9PLEO|nr:alpha/beta-hydrolase [Melanomma pulvis-pyrius CBS 109.77]